MKRFLLSLTTAAVLLSAAPAFAQTAPAAPDSPSPPTPMPAAGLGGGRHGAQAAQHRLQQFHDRLGITAAQQPQWDAMLATLRENGQAMQANSAVQAMRSGQLHGVPALQAAADVARLRADAMGKLIPTVQALYDVLTPQQRQVADAELDRLLHVGGGRHGRGRG